MTKQNNENQDKKSGFIPYLFVIFFAVIFAINAFYIYIAQTNWRGIATENSYQKGLKYNETLEYVKSQKKLGWDLTLQFANKEKNRAELTVCLLDKNKKKISDAKINVKITRPIQEGSDFTQNLIPKDNCYFTKINFPFKGLWNLEIQAFKDEKVLQKSQRFVVQ